jgi:L-asparaginase II
MKSKMPLSVEVVRGSTVESHHNVMAVMMDETGATVGQWGNPEFLTFPRSAIKMLQALPLIETGTADAFELNDVQLCLSCASHNGEEKHIMAIASYMKRTGVRESMLACGAHLPYNEQAAHELIRRDVKPTPIVNNCSGKHTGMMATCIHLKENPEGYERYDHPQQVRVRRALSETMQLDVHKAPYGIDGCGIPTYALPLKNLALGMVSLISAKESADRRFAARKLIEAVRREPFYIAGTGDFNTEVILKTDGRCVVKGGAEGVFCGVIPEKGLAFALKAEDGSGRASQAAAGCLLQSYGAITAAESESLKSYLQPKVKNWKGLEVGQIRVNVPE